MIKKIIIGFVVILVSLFAFVAITIFSAGRPTDGPAIANYENPQKALLVIDIQEDYTGKTARVPFPYKNSEQLIDKINSIITKAKDRGLTIVYIRQEFSGFPGTTLSNIFLGNTAIEGTPGAAVDSRIRVVSENSFSKPKGDSFSNEELSRFLIENRVNELYLAGIDGEACVHLTAQGALSRKYKVNIITDAIALFKEENREGLLKECEEEGISMLTSSEF